LINLSLCRLPLFEISFEEMSILIRAMHGNEHVRNLELWLPKATNHQPPTDDDGDAIMDENHLGHDECEDMQLGDGADLACPPAWRPEHPSSDSYAFLTCALAKNATLETLSVTHAASSEAWCHLFRGIQDSSSVRHLVIGESTVDKHSLDDAACRQLSLVLSEKGRRTSFSSLQTLTMRGVHVSVAGAQALAAGIVNSSLCHLELHQVEVRLKQEDPLSASSLHIGQFLVAITPAPLESLTVADCDLHLEDVDEDENHPLTAFAASQTTVRCLRLWDCLDVDGVRPLALGLLENQSTSLSTLDLRYNTLSVISCEALSELLKRTTSSVQELILEETCLDDECVSCLCPGLAGNTSLRKLVLRGNSLSSGSCSFLEKALNRHPSCQFLDVSENGLGDVGANALCSLLRLNAVLQELQVESTGLTDEGMEVLSAGIEQNHTLRSVSMGQNDMRPRGARAVARAIAGNICLKELDLSSCGIADDSLSELIYGLTRNRTIEHLGLAFNEVGNDGVQTLGRALPGFNLKVLDLSFNNFDATGMEQLVRGLSRNYLLHDLIVLNSGTKNGTQSDPRLLELLSHYLSLNRAGRRAIPASLRVPLSLWPAVLARADQAYGPNALFHILQEQPHCAHNQSY
jgi:Ran GTPase-activating protein (RanGAP) involved in mRNA processing and transport